MDSLFVRYPVLLNRKLTESVLIVGSCILTTAYIVSVVIPGDANIILLSIFAMVGLLCLRYPIVLLGALVVASQFFSDIERVKGLQLWGLQFLSSYDIFLMMLVLLLFARIALGEKLYLRRLGYSAAIFPLLFVYLIESFYLYEGLELLNFIKITVMTVGIYFGFYHFVRKEDDVRRIVTVFVVIYFLHAVYAIMQSMVFDLKLLDPTVLFIKLQGPSVGFYDNYYLTRKLGFFYRGNSLGKSMVMMVLMMFAFHRSLFTKRISAISFILLFTVASFLSLTRQAVVGLIVTSILACFLGRENKKLLLASVMGLTLLAVGFMYSEVFSDRMATYKAISSYSAAMADKSMVSRLDVWRDVVGGELRGTELSRRGVAADSGYISVLANSGMVGVLVFLAFFILGILRAWKNRNAGGLLGACHAFVLLYMTALAIFSLVSNATAGHGFTPLLMFMGISDKLALLQGRVDLSSRR